MKRFKNGLSVFNDWQEMKKIMLKQEREDKKAGRVVELNRFWSFMLSLVLFLIIYLISYDIITGDGILGSLSILIPDFILGLFAIIFLYSAIFGKSKKLEELTDEEWIKMFQIRRKMVRFMLKFRGKKNN